MTLQTPSERRRERVAEVRRLYTLEKARGRCAHCGLADPEALDYHHRWPTSKRATVSALVSRGASWARVYREVVDCTLLCAGCHRRLHATQR